MSQNGDGRAAAGNGNDGGSDGAWGDTGHDPFADPEERRVLFAAIDSFRQYRRYQHHALTHCRRQAFYALPQKHQRLLNNKITLLDTLSTIDDAIDSNANISDVIFEQALAAFGLPPPSAFQSPPPTSLPGPVADNDASSRQRNAQTQNFLDYRGMATIADMSKARSTISQFYRDWSSDGAVEREKCYKPLLLDLMSEFPFLPLEGVTTSLDEFCPRNRRTILVPGAGLGRLVFEITRLGFVTEGNDISYHALLASQWALNFMRGPNEYSLFPFVAGFTNQKSRRHGSGQLFHTSFPDIQPGKELARLAYLAKTIAELDNAASDSCASSFPPKTHERELEIGVPGGSMSMTAADFLSAYSGPANRERYDAVCTCFFIDTCPNVLRVTECVHNSLKTGGIWTNLGPLMWHFDGEGPQPVRTTATAKRESSDVNANLGISEPGSVELCDDEVIIIVESMGFKIEKHEVGQNLAGYISDLDSMLKSEYVVSHWVARKI